MGKGCWNLTYTRLDQFADLMADGLSIPDACERMAIKRGRGDTFLWRLRRDLGAQAI
jgi:hypothetical protein